MEPWPASPPGYDAAEERLAAAEQSAEPETRELAARLRARREDMLHARPEDAELSRRRRERVDAMLELLSVICQAGRHEDRPG
jgi:hypothetical protein